MYKFDIQQYLSYFEFNNIKINNIIEIVIFIVIVFYLIKHFQNTRIWVLIKGIFVMFLIYALSAAFSLKIITNLFQSIISFFIIALIMMFQPELRKMLESVGNKTFLHNVRSHFGKQDNKRFTDHTIQEIVSAVDSMSKVKTGALILIENDIPLDEYVKTGISINSDITSQLITNIFEKNTPLHDGAMIIKNNKIVSATCYLPLSESKSIDKALGTRHRAAIGASEQTDAFIIVVSEETGAISYVYNGKIKHKISSSELAEQLQSINYTIKPTNSKNRKHLFRNTILSVIFGIFFWGLLSIVYNPVETVTINNIPVTIENEQIIEKLNKVYEVVDGETVSIEVTGPKSTIDTLHAEDFVATADLSKLSITNTASIKVTTDKNVKVNTKNAVLQITVEDASELELSIDITKTGKEAYGYYVYNLATSTPTVKVTGPKSIIQTIDKAVANVNVNGANEDFETTAQILVYDKNGAIINDKDCSVNISSISVDASVYNTKEVPVVLDIINNNDDAQIEVIDQKTSTDTVIVAASNELLESIDSITIPIDVTNSSSNTINSIIDLRNYLPSGVIYVGEDNFEYTIEIGKYVTREFELYPNNIEIKNGEAKITTQKININVTFDKNTVDNVNLSQAKPFIDVSDLAPGKYSLPIQFDNLENIKIEDIYNVDVVVENNET